MNQFAPDSSSSSLANDGWLRRAAKAASFSMCVDQKLRRSAAGSELERLPDQAPRRAAGTGRGTGRRSARRCRASGVMSARAASASAASCTASRWRPSLARAKPRPLYASAFLGSSSMASSKSRRASFGASDHQVSPTSICLHGRRRVQLERLREIFDGARVLAQLGACQAAAAIDRLERLPRLQIAVERRRSLPRNGPAGTRSPHAAAGPANGLCAMPGPRRMTPAPARASRCASSRRPRSMWSSTW